LKIENSIFNLQFSIFNTRATMHKQLRRILESEQIEASAPCRVDMGGTLDISTFNFPLRHLRPCTFNIALDLRTRVRLQPYTRGMIKITSKGFRDARFAGDAAPFDHPLGLMFAAAAYFNIEGIHIDIASQSPPRSALGGSSVAAVALIAALSKLTALAQKGGGLDRRRIALLAYHIEQSVAGVPCGLQDQLAAAYGGVNVWHWSANPYRSLFKKDRIFGKAFYPEFERHLLVAYCGRPHVSKDINGRWVKQFLSGRQRRLWLEIVACTQEFVEALAVRDFRRAASLMNRETSLRSVLTPDVLDPAGTELTGLARQAGCGARFTGAGGGGCLWALGDIENIDRLRPLWEKTLAAIREARLLDVKIDSKGLVW
jgi:D-glycero-alpha-D-manno-heptose-7-phosphate kinase